MRTAPLALALVCLPAAAQASGGGDLPPDLRRWEAVAAPPGRHVLVRTPPERAVRGVVDVWTWHAFEAPYRPARGPAYDRVVAHDRVYCGLRATAPLRELRSLGGVGVGAFTFPAGVGPYGWAPGSTAEAVGERVCRGETPPRR